MRPILQALMIFAVGLCGSHVAEPVQAHSGAAHQLMAEAAHFGGDQHDKSGSEQGSDEAAHANAHHCPHAAALRSHDAVWLDGRDLKPVARPMRALASRIIAPPEEPPLS